MKYLISLVLSLVLGGVAWADNFYCVLFAPDCSCPRYCHVWGTFVQMKKDKLVKEVTISWTPIHDWTLRDRQQSGYNMSLSESFASSRNHATCVWGPFAIGETTFQKAVRKYQMSGDYKMLDTLSRRAENCIHRLSSISGKRLITHVRYGKYAAAAVYRHYRKHHLIFHTADGEKVIKVLGLEHRPLRRMVK